MKTIVSTQWLAENLARPDVRVIDASWHLPGSDRNGLVEFNKTHIPKAVFFDIDEIAATSSGLPHMMPSAEQFAKAASSLGINNQDQIVVYDSLGLFSAARVWFMFRAMGHENVAVLDGGLPKWNGEDRMLSEDITPPARTLYRALLDETMIVSAKSVLGNISENDCLIIDARSAGRFAGSAPEPRMGVRSGHIPSSQHLAYQDVLSTDNTFHSLEDLKLVLSEIVDAGPHSIIASCGSGATACILLLALEMVGVPGGKLYDGSWAEWGSNQELPIEIGSV